MVKDKVTMENIKNVYDQGKGFAMKVDGQLDAMGVDKKEVAHKTGKACMEAGKAVADALLIGTKAVINSTGDNSGNKSDMDGQKAKDGQQQD